MNGIALLSLLATVTAPPWQVELAETTDDTFWKIHVDQPLLDQWATAGKKRVAHTTRIELPAQPAVKAFLIRFGDKPLASDWIPLAGAAGELTFHPQVDPTGCQTEIRLHPALTRRLKLGGYELRGQLPAGPSPHGQLVIQITAAQPSTAPPAASRDNTLTPPLKAVTRSSPVFAEPPRGTAKAWPPRTAASTDISAMVGELPSSAALTPDIMPEARNNIGDLARTEEGQPRPPDAEEEMRADQAVPQALLSDTPLSDTPEPAAPPAVVLPAVTEATGRQRYETDARDTDTVRPATYLAEAAPVEAAPPRSGLANNLADVPGSAAATPPLDGDPTVSSSVVPLPTAPARTTAGLPEHQRPPDAVADGDSKPPAQWLLLVLGLFASVGLNVFLVINHRTIAGQYRQLVARTYQWEPGGERRAEVASGTRPADPDRKPEPQTEPAPGTVHTAEAGAGETRPPDEEIDPLHGDGSDTQTADNVADQEEHAVVHRRKKRNQRHQ